MVLPAHHTADSSRHATSTGAVRMFGRFQLLRLLGKSERGMLWLALDPRDQQEVMLAMPRTQPGEGAGAWQQAVRRAARLNHPRLAKVLDIGEHERWPYVVYERSVNVTWAERLSSQGLPGTELADWVAQAAQGLAFAHEAGTAHHDLQPWWLLVDDDNRVSVLGLEVAGAPRASITQPGGLDELRAVRDAAGQDVLALGLVAHWCLAGQPPLDEPDIGRVIACMPPMGADIVRLPWTVPRPIAEPLRAIVNRATDRQERHRYLNARTLQRALEGWIKTTTEQDGGPLALLLDRLRQVGTLPAQPGGADRAAHMALMESARTSDLAEIVLEDLALTFELLRTVNNAQVHGGRVSGDGPVLMLRRAIAMLGVDGVRRAALSLRRWPGPMNEQAASELDTLIRRVKRAGRVATRLVPAGYDGEVVYLIALLQNLGRLLVQYHFPDEAGQIRRLMQPTIVTLPHKTPGMEPETKEEPGMSAEAASYAVLGADLEALGAAVARHWGLDDSVQHMIRRIAPTAPVRTPESDGDILRVCASCANDLVDAMTLPAARAPKALNLAVQRYARPLGLTGRDMQDALQGEGARKRPATDAAPARNQGDAAGNPAAGAPQSRKPPAGPWSEALEGTLT
ncbi:MAG TPA: HDOD domain-containing protein [Ideonella sp.]|uniref:serine/threonine protein kinase n=1 Tax=Ideonella sp. TaxID=1929293 RepID=UPI002E37C40C|nr:HDOD domain-containing protein [Ideonella sp.]HEX5688345.1 HDOD domain-containing protein [Ideonella sp.]